jgi:hypothetical protein
MSSEVVWLVTANGVYDHGVWFVGRSLGEAEAFCAEYAPDIDGYHTWEITEMPVSGVPSVSEPPRSRWPHVGVYRRGPA